MSEWAELGGLFLAAFLASTILPGGSEVAFALIVQGGNYAELLLVAIATVGNTLGGMTSWGIGRLLPRPRQREAEIEPSSGRRRSKGPGWASAWRRIRARVAGEDFEDRPPRERGAVSSDEEYGAPDRTDCESPPPEASPHLARAAERVRRYGALALLASWVPVIGDPLCIAAGWLRIGWLPALVCMAIGKGGRYTVLALAI